ncbi:hypothetical protein, partial [Alicycliphilus denitrificans]|uniref:hypothetical protein n=1 Tax=Alicycliphilus denitrificans TaxID=179636 RepID=UPI001CA56E0F
PRAEKFSTIERQRGSDFNVNASRNGPDLEMNQQPTIALRSEDHAWSVLAEVLAVSPNEIRGYKSPHRLHVTGILEAPQLPANRGLELSDWLRCTPHFMDAVEAGHPSEAALWSALAPPATS